MEPRYCWTRRNGEKHERYSVSATPARVFHDWLVQQRNVSHHTVLSYRDSWRLFLRFVAARKVTSVSRLGLGDLSEMQVLAFLNDIEQVRKSSIGTRNCRLAALHSFFNFVADREPLAAAQCAAVLRIPNKKMSKPEVSGLDEDEITAILAQPNRSKAEGQRDHVLLAVLYNTGARIQEALDLSPQSVRWESPFQVRLNEVRVLVRDSADRLILEISKLSKPERRKRRHWQLICGNHEGPVQKTLGEVLWQSGEVE